MRARILLRLFWLLLLGWDGDRIVAHMREVQRKAIITTAALG